MTSTSVSLAELNAEYDRCDGRPADSEEYQRFTTLVLNEPAAARLAQMDPFSSAYRQAAMELYLQLRGRAAEGYVLDRDERSDDPAPKNLWRDVSPWSFQDPDFVSEFLVCWAQMMRLLDFGHKNNLSILEYGTGSGQFLLMLARLGVKVHGVDIDAASLNLVRAQAEAQNLQVETEQAAFGEGFLGQTFDRIVFFEAFHHAFDFLDLLVRLRERLNPGGKLMLCGEPVVHEQGGAVPFPWGPRLDILSIFCMKKQGWMELGFTHEFLMQAFERTGWKASFHPAAGCGRANIYLAERTGDSPLSEQPAPSLSPTVKPNYSMMFKVRWKLSRWLNPERT